MRSAKLKIDLKRALKVVGIVCVLSLLAVPVLVRLTGTLLMSADGRAIGYSKQTDEWLLHAYPTFPARRDGPYVLNEGGQRMALTLEPRSGSEAVAVRAPVGNEIQVVVDDAAGTSFRVALRDHYPRSAPQWAMPERLLVISDLEGNFAAATSLLRAQGVIDDQLQWRYGAGQLVVLGDMVDRGDNVVPLLWLLYRLQAQAHAAGDALHYVLGNHEQYLLQGRPKSAHRKYLGTARVAGVVHGELWSQRTELGRWLRSQPILLRIGDTLFVHGGISPQVLALGLDLAAIDKLAARDVGAFRRSESADDEVVLGRAGLLWYRGLAKASDGQPLAGSAHVDALLAHHGASRIAIGHTLVEHVGQSYGGRVLRTDVAHTDGTIESILFADGDIWRVDAAGTRAPLGEAVNL